MECIVYLFPETVSMPEAYCTKFLSSNKSIAPSEQLKEINETLLLHKSVEKTSANYKGVYFPNNVLAFVSSFSQSGYPKSITLLREMFKGTSMKNATTIFKSPTSNHNIIYSFPTISDDYFVLASWHKITTKDSISCVIVDSLNSIEIPVCCDGATCNLHLFPASLKALWEWLSVNHSPSRTFEMNPKHTHKHQMKRGVASQWPYKVEMSQTLLNKAIPQGNCLVYFDPDQEAYLVFRCHDNSNHLYHGYPDAQFNIENDVRKILIKLGVINE